MAYHAMEEESLFIARVQIECALEHTLSQYNRLTNRRNKERLLRSVTNQFGFLRETKQENRSKSKVDQHYYFIHLSFQEFYAARYVAQTLSASHINDAGSQVLQTLVSKKYTSRHQLMLRMSAGLLYQEGKKNNNFTFLMKFWDAIFSPPRALIGSQHQVLALHCLDECEADEEVPLHKKLDQKFNTYN